MTEDDVRAKVVIGEDRRGVQARFGEPDFDFGPGRVLVYPWRIKYGKIFWLVGSQVGFAGGFLPWTDGYLLIIAFDSDGKVLKAGTKHLWPFDSISEHVRQWLVSSDLASQVVGPRVGVSTYAEPKLFIYRPSSSPCPFPTYDANVFKLSIAIDGKVVGDVQKGEYLGVDVTVGAHMIKIDLDSTFETSRQVKHVPASVNFSGDPSRPTYVEAYLCTGTGTVEAHATVRDEPTALEEIRDYVPAW